ncbi:MAG: hypothetical protein ACI4PB_07875 [Oscillospiraceae bacterium]
MKRALLMVCSICLVLACLFGLFACVAGMKDALNIQEYKQEDADHAREGIAAARDGIKQLQENEDVYLNGVGTYEAGLIELSSGKSALNAGYKEYYAGKKALEEGKKAYAEGVKALEAGKKEYEAGKQKIADNTQAYNEGKEKLAKIEPLMPYLNQYVEFRDGTIAKLPGFDNAQVWFVKTVRPIAAQLGITIPDDVTDFPAFMNKMVAEGKAQLKEYEDGVAKLAEAEKTIAAGEKKLAAAEKEIAAGEKKLADAEKQLAAGEKKLAAGKNELAAGDAKLSVYEGGQEQLAAGMQQLLDEMVPCTTRSGKQTVPGLKELLGDDFSIWVLDDNGEVKVERGCQFVDLDACTKLCDEAEHYLEIQEADIKSELYPRIAMNVMMAIAAIVGIVASIVAIVGAVTGSKKTGFVGGIITAVLAVAANIVGIFVGYTDFVYQTREVVDGVKEYTYSGDLQLYALIVLAVIAVIFTIVAGIARSAAKKAEAETVAQANQAAAAGAAAAAVAAAEAEAAPVEAAPAAESEKIADLEAENAALKEMVAKLAADAATVKE